MSMGVITSRKKHSTPILSLIEEPALPEELTFQAKLRQAIYDGVSESDVADVVKGIVAKAKDGDTAAQKMFFEYVLGAKTKPTQVIVHNHVEGVEEEGVDVELQARIARARRRRASVSNTEGEKGGAS